MSLKVVKPPTQGKIRQPLATSFVRHFTYKNKRFGTLVEVATQRLWDVFWIKTAERLRAPSVRRDTSAANHKGMGVGAEQFGA
jgi:hypothetical protein